MIFQVLKWTVKSFMRIGQHSYISITVELGAEKQIKTKVSVQLFNNWRIMT